MKLEVNNFLKIFFAIFMFVGLMFVILGISTTVHMTNVKHNYIPVEGVISRISHGGSSDNSTAFVKYRVKGRFYEADTHSYSSSWDVGDRIKIYCNPKDPSDIETTVTADSLPLIFIGMGLPFFFIGFIPLWKIRKFTGKRKKLLEIGHKVTGTVVGYDIDSSISVNRRHPYIAFVEYDNGDGQKHRFKSESIWAPLDDSVLGKSVDVYFEEGNMDNYVVDEAPFFSIEENTEEDVCLR